MSKPGRSSFSTRGISDRHEEQLRVLEGGLLLRAQPGLAEVAEVGDADPA